MIDIEDVTTGNRLVCNKNRVYKLNFVLLG